MTGILSVIRKISFCLLCTVLVSSLVAETVAFKIYGTVSDSDGKALERAAVSLYKENFEVQSDMTGAYFLKFTTEVLPKKYKIVFTRSGYKSTSRVFTLKSASSKVIPLSISLSSVESTDLDVSVDSASSGYQAADKGTSEQKTAANLSSGKKKEPYKVHKTADGSQVKSSVTTVRTKKELRYFMGRPTWVDVPLTAAEIALEDAKIAAIKVAQEPKPKKPVTISGPPVKFSIRGNVVNDKGRPVGAAEVFLGKAQEAYAKTDRRGRFVLEFIVPSAAVQMGRTVIIQHRNFATRYVPVRFNPKREAGITLDNINLQRYRGMLDR